MAYLPLFVTFKPTSVSAGNRQDRVRVLRYLQSIEMERLSNSNMSNNTAETEVRINTNSLASDIDEDYSQNPNMGSLEHVLVSEDSFHSATENVEIDESEPSDKGD